jgi:hypothetical protein
MDGGKLGIWTICQTTKICLARDASWISATDPPSAGGWSSGWEGSTIHCWGHGSQEMLAKAWSPYQEDVREIVRMVLEERNDVTGLVDG